MSRVGFTERLEEDSLQADSRHPANRAGVDAPREAEFAEKYSLQAQILPPYTLFCAARLMETASTA